MINRVIILVLAYIMYGCTLSPADSRDMIVENGDDMTVARHQQQRAISGKLKPGGTNGVVFSLPFMLDANGYQDPGNYTVQFNVSDPNTGLNSGDFVRARAQITWMNGGNQVTRVVDCGNGVSVSGTCEGVTVRVFDDSITNNGSTFVEYTVGISVAKGSRASIQQPPTYSTNAATLTVGGAVNVDIPQNIGAISVFVTVAPALDAALGAYQVEVTQVSGNLFRLKRYDPRQSDWVPLVPGATQIRITSAPTASDFLYQVTFGIDG